MSQHFLLSTRKSDTQSVGRMPEGVIRHSQTTQQIQATFHPIKPSILFVGIREWFFGEIRERLFGGTPSGFRLTG